MEIGTFKLQLNIEHCKLFLFLGSRISEPAAFSLSFNFDERKMPQGEVKAYEGCDILDGGPCLPCQQSIKLEAQIVAAKGPALDNLLILKRNLRTEINDHHDPITRRLPPELTSRVFEIYSEESNVRDWEISQYQVFKPLVLGANSPRQSLQQTQDFVASSRL
ncbi:hypothetical protein CVT25_000690 [Psilocybe cyanescens]|uniref:Uncharacterized protein n=1 Tax=Psilocybe cyanescens TaxID=93625 RepID=A0A409WZL0_PSICY|nr:hypothetical protein CVT25_000690 [Psilocybe cyanescens]